ncbi:MAG: hypothetical protein AVDCRST_MAG22-1202 [uncultured Rubrobacteraceae bacterium]|uniref:Secreted protein n=1 Tax=uncultured Rubrobacteraceae bacterium TaxID=349277 RepID=A0A6J4P066_9ACTN|nr:MAG: hypothetical protein AVDCRST_MAG22-1202 [uncultured Rubrobacteraceae bacterium]
MTSRRTPIVMALVVAALLAAAWATSAAAANRVEVASRVTFSQSAPFHGRVLSLKAACERNRTVAVFRVDPGSDGLYGGTKSGAGGGWSIPAGMPNGKFYAVVKQRSIDTAGKTFVCKKAVSPKAAF